MVARDTSGNAVLVPEVMLKEGAGVYLDDLDGVALAVALGVPVHYIEPSPWGLYAAIK